MQSHLDNWNKTNQDIYWLVFHRIHAHKHFMKSKSNYVNLAVISYEFLPCMHYSREDFWNLLLSAGVNIAFYSDLTLTKHQQLPSVSCSWSSRLHVWSKYSCCYVSVQLIKYCQRIPDSSDAISHFDNIL